MRNFTTTPYWVLALLLFAFLQEVSSQNLVPNGGFEEGTCPQTLSGIEMECSNWYQSIAVPGVEWFNNPSPDWFHTCSDQELLSPPNTLFGFQDPFEGEAFAGFYTYAEETSSIREILGVELTEAMSIGQFYQIGFRLSKAYSPSNRMSSNKIGVKFSLTNTYESLEDAVNNFAHFVIDTLITDTTNWNQFNFQFEADQAYTHIHIGNFFTDDLTDAEGDTIIGDALAYYFIDNVEVNMPHKPV